MKSLLVLILMVYVCGCNSFSNDKDECDTTDLACLQSVGISNAFVDYPADLSLKILKLLPQSGLSFGNEGTIYKETYSNNTVLMSGEVAEGFVFIKLNLSTKNVEVLSKKFSSVRANKYTIHNNIVYFVAQDFNDVEQLWSYNTLNNAFQKITNFSKSQLTLILEVFNQGSNVYFTPRLYNAPNVNRDIWSYNTSNLSLTKITDFVSLNTNARDLDLFYKNGNKLYFAYGQASVSYLVEFDMTVATLTQNTLTSTGTNFGVVEPIGIIGSDFYVNASTSETGYEIYKINLITYNTSLVIEVSPGSGSTYIQNVVNFENSFYLTMSLQGPQNVGSELYVFDPVSNTVNLVEDIFLGSTSGVPNSSNPDDFKVVGDKLYFIARDNLNYNNSVFRLQNGSITEFANTIQPSYGLLENLAGKLFFSYGPLSYLGSFQESNSSFDADVILSSNLLGFSDFDGIVRFDSNRFFISANHPLVGNSLWSYNQSSNSVQIVAETFLGSEGDQIYNLTVHNGYVYYTAKSNSNGQEIWRFNVTTSNLERLTNLNPNNTFAIGIDSINILNNSLYYFARSSTRTEIFRYDILNGTTTLISNTFVYSVFHTLSTNDIYFVAAEPITGFELRKINTITNQVSTVIDYVPGASNINMSELTYHNGVLYFVCNCNNLGSEIWKLNETLNTFELAVDVHQGTTSSSPKNLSAIDGSLYFTASNSSARLGAFRYNLTTNSLSVIANYNIDTTTNFEQDHFVKNGDKIYFVKNDSTKAYNIVSYNLDTLTLTDEVDLINNDSAGDVYNLQIFDNRLYYFKNRNGHYLQL